MGIEDKEIDMPPELPNFPVGTVNVKCTPSDDNWPSDSEMHTADYGGFYPDEVKALPNDERLQRLVRSGEFTVVDEDPNSLELRQQIAEKRAEDAAAEQEEADEAGISVGALRARKEREAIDAAVAAAEAEEK
jgi:hypothetical protein